MANLLGRLAKLEAVASVAAVEWPSVFIQTVDQSADGGAQPRPVKGWTCAFGGTTLRLEGESEADLQARASAAAKAVAPAGAVPVFVRSDR